MGSAGPVTINSERLLDTPVIETLCRPSFVTATVAAALCVFTLTDPKLNEVGAIPTSACTGIGNNAKPARLNPTNRHTSSVLFMDRQSLVVFSGARGERGEGGGGLAIAARDFYLQRKSRSRSSLTQLVVRPALEQVRLCPSWPKMNCPDYVKIANGPPSYPEQMRRDWGALFAPGWGCGAGRSC